MTHNFFERIQNFALTEQKRIIVRDHRGEYTWEQLWSNAWGFAELLERRNASALVSIIVDRSFESVSAMLGALLSGRTFVPLLATAPKERLGACISATGSDTIIFASAFALEELIQYLGQPRAIVALDVKPSTASTHELPIYDPENLIYVLFTSGSTGFPKGVKLNFRNIENTMCWGQETFDWFADDVVGSVCSFSFDIAMFDLMCSFYYGVPLAILSKPEDPQFSLTELMRFNVTSVFSVPAFFSRFVEYGLIDKAGRFSLRRIISGGDFFPASHLLAWLDYAPEVAVYNVWGPTETSIVNTAHLVVESDREKLLSGHSVSVGAETARMPLFLLDEKGQVISQAQVKGEVCMIGDCVSQGYLNVDPEKQREVYFNVKGLPAFRTSDIGFYDAEMNLYIVGRKGSTVKIRGFRVDLAEVERAAESVPAVSVAGAFVSQSVPEIAEIWLCVESNRQTDLDIYEIKRSLRMILPNYMVPKRIFLLERLPRNANGKVDRLKLRDFVAQVSL